MLFQLLSMQRYFFFWLIFLVAFTTGCSDVTFQESIPLNRKNLNAFPKAWHGSWADAEGKVYTISADAFARSDSASENVQLGPSVLLRRFQGYLVLNQRQEDDTWQVLLAKRKKNRISLYQFDSSDDQSVAIWEAVLGSSMRQKRLQLMGMNRDSYVLSPENNLALRRLIFKGGLTEFGTLLRITN
jgi:hypothetical protein